MLVPHEPDADPRIGWSLSLCRAIGRTDVIATTWSAAKPAKEYDGVVSVERIDAMTYASPNVVRASSILQRLDATQAARRFVERAARKPAKGALGPQYHVGGLFRLIAAWSFYAIIVSALGRRARAVSVPPRLIVAHDIYALLPAVALKRRFGSRLLYDTHEFFPESDLLAPRWQRWLTRAVERRYIRQADAVVTVSPPLARELERVYRIKNVVAAPNAQPFEPSPQPVPPVRGEPIRFLLQGQASPGRGIDRLFELWEALDDERATLLVRIPDGPYPLELRQRFAGLFASERAQWLPAVPERELVSAARSAHVGIIPYVGPSKNHLFSSPNKLSQYMLAGLAVLSTDLPFISSVLERHDCGATYDADDAESFRAAVDLLIASPERLQSFRQHAQAAARDKFNWATVSGDYRGQLERLFSDE